MSDRGLRYNTGKPRWDLVPMDAVEELVQVFTYGSAKYAPRNWEKGMPWMECYASLMRHLSDWSQGRDYDGAPGVADDTHSGLLTMAHVAWNAMALLTFQLRGVGEDDRPVVPLPLRAGGEPGGGVEPNENLIADIHLPLRGPNYKRILDETVNAFLNGEMGAVSSDPEEILASFADALLGQLETDRDFDQLARALHDRDDDPLLQVEPDEKREEDEGVLDFAAALEQEIGGESDTPRAPEAPEVDEKPASAPEKAPDGEGESEEPRDAGSVGKEAW